MQDCCDHTGAPYNRIVFDPTYRTWMIRAVMNKWIFLSLAVVAFVWISVATVVGQRGESNNANAVLAGTIDIHVHSDPDSRPRSIDALEVAKLSRSKGMRGIVLKNHYDP